SPLFYHYSFHLFLFNDAATTVIYTLSLHDALPIFATPGHLEEALHLGQQHSLAIDDFYRGVNTPAPDQWLRVRLGRLLVVSIGSWLTLDPGFAGGRHFRIGRRLCRRLGILFEVVWRILHGLNLMASEPARGRAPIP